MKLLGWQLITCNACNNLVIVVMATAGYYIPINANTHMHTHIRIRIPLNDQFAVIYTDIIIFTCIGMLYCGLFSV